MRGRGIRGTKGSGLGAEAGPRAALPPEERPTSRPPARSAQVSSHAATTRAPPPPLPAAAPRSLPLRIPGSGWAARACAPRRGGRPAPPAWGSCQSGAPPACPAPPCSGRCSGPPVPGSAVRGQAGGGGRQAVKQAGRQAGGWPQLWQLRCSASGRLPGPPHPPAALTCSGCRVDRAQRPVRMVPMGCAS